MPIFNIAVDPEWSFNAWRDRARDALHAGIEPAQLQWENNGQGGLAMGARLPVCPGTGRVFSVPGRLVELAGAAVCHSKRGRHALLYRILWRLLHGERGLLDRATDADIVAVNALAQAVRRDAHKMKAFVRFRKLAADDAYVAWFEPEHAIVDRVAPFFARRFTGMRWAILTPYRSVRWDGTLLMFGPGAVRADAPAEDAQEDLWRIYYANIFNPARINPTMMRQEMPQKYWKGLPEATLLPNLLREAGSHVRQMVEREPEPPRRRIPASEIPAAKMPDGSLSALRERAATCQHCELWQAATQTVWGEGPADARVMVVGEQPGDEEDLTGKPFVGPSGKLFDRALGALGLDRKAIYVTNAVKHFRFEQRGKRRMHKTPAAAHALACQTWLRGELSAVRPNIVVCLGATAARAIIGPHARVMEMRGQWQALADGRRVVVTVHPSWILRQRTPAERDDAYAGFVDDLRLVAHAVHEA